MACGCPSTLFFWKKHLNETLYKYLYASNCVRTIAVVCRTWFEPGNLGLRQQEHHSCWACCHIVNHWWSPTVLRPLDRKLQHRDCVHVSVSAQIRWWSKARTMARSQGIFPHTYCLSPCYCLEKEGKGMHHPLEMPHLMGPGYHWRCLKICSNLLIHYSQCLEHTVRKQTQPPGLGMLAFYGKTNHKHLK